MFHVKHNCPFIDREPLLRHFDVLKCNYVTDQLIIIFIFAKSALVDRHFSVNLDLVGIANFFKRQKEKYIIAKKLNDNGNGYQKLEIPLFSKIMLMLHLPLSQSLPVPCKIGLSNVVATKAKQNS